MIRIESFLNRQSVATSLFIYENEEEFEASPYTLVDPRVAQRLDYFKTDDGYYLPIIKRDDFLVKAKTHKMIKFTFPFQLSVTHTLYLSKDGNPAHSRFRRKSFYFAEYRKPKKYTKSRSQYLNANEMLAAELVARGVDIHDAFKVAFPALKNRTYNRDVAIREASKKPGFIEYIMEHSNMELIKKALDSADAHTKAAKSLIELLEAVDKDGNPHLPSRKFALQAYVSLERMVSEDDNKGTYEIKNAEISDNLKAKLSGSLPE